MPDTFVGHMDTSHRPSVGPLPNDISDFGDSSVPAHPMRRAAGRCLPPSPPPQPAGSAASQSAQCCTTPSGGTLRASLRGWRNVAAGICRVTCAGNSTGTFAAASSGMDSSGSTAGPAGMTSWWPSRARVGRSARRAGSAGWSSPLHAGSIACSRWCPSGNGCCHCPSNSAHDWPGTATCSPRSFGSSRRRSPDNSGCSLQRVVTSSSPTARRASFSRSDRL